MSWRQHLARIRTLFSRRNPAEDLDREIRSHLEFAEEENRTLGMSEAEARYAARRDFGNVTRTLEEARNRWVYRRCEDALQDIRYGLRTLAKSREFAVVSVVTLALGISANTAIFSFADLIIRRPVALPQLDRLVAVSEYIPWTEQQGVSYANYLDLQAHSRSVAALAAYQSWSAVRTRQGEPEEVGGVRVTENFFSALKLEPALGRTFLPEEAQPGNEHVLLISNDFWRRQFGGNPAVLGKTLELNQRLYTIVGIMPPKNTFPLGAPAFWAPLAFTPQDRSERIDLALAVVGRLAPGATLEQARAEFETLWAQVEKDFPRANANRSLRVNPLTDEIVKDYNVQFTLLLLGVVAFVLLIACANVAGLQLARAAGRQTEIAVRACVGASRARLMTQFVTESVLLAVIGGLFGLLLALWGVHLLRVTLPPEVQEICNLEDLRVGSAALLFTVFVTFFAGVLSGIAPAWQMSGSDFERSLRAGESRLAGGPGHRLRRLLVVGETALALVLLIGAGLMVKGFATLLHGNQSLAPDSLLTLHINLPQSRYGEPFEKKAFWDQALSRLQALPRVESAALASGVPYSFYDDNVSVRIVGSSEPPSAQLPVVMAESVSPDYFRALRIPLREGREFDARDSADTATVALVSESMARRFWPGQSPIGKKLFEGPGDPGTELTVVGVVGDIVHEVFDRSFRPFLYRPYAQAPPNSMDLVLRPSESPARLIPVVRSEVQQIDRELLVERPETMSRKIENQTNGLRYVAKMMAILGAVALVLSVVGVYGMMAYSVKQRRREMAIRLALGAQSRDVMAMLMRVGISLALSGIGVGVALALALTHLLASLFYGVHAWDAAAFSATPAVLAASAMLASYLPARRATRLDPMVILRYE